MSRNKKTFVRWMRFIALLTALMVGYLVIYSNYNEPEKIEYYDIKK